MLKPSDVMRIVRTVFPSPSSSPCGSSIEAPSKKMSETFPFPTTVWITFLRVLYVRQFFHLMFSSSSGSVFRITSRTETKSGWIDESSSSM